MKVYTLVSTTRWQKKSLTFKSAFAFTMHIFVNVYVDVLSIAEPLNSECDTMYTFAIEIFVDYNISVAVKSAFKKRAHICTSMPTRVCIRCIAINFDFCAELRKTISANKPTIEHNIIIPEECTMKLAHDCLLNTNKTSYCQYHTRRCDSYFLKNENINSRTLIFRHSVF